MRVILICILAMILAGCVKEHVVVDGACLTCFNNPVSGEAMNYSPNTHSNRSRTMAENGTSNIKEKGIDLSYLDASTYYYHWAAHSSKPYEHIEFIASVYFREYIAANEFEKQRVIKKISPIINSRIKQAKTLNFVNRKTHLNLYEYNFNNQSFKVSFLNRNALGIDVFGKSSFSKELVYDIPSRSKVELHVSPNDAEVAVNAAGGGRRWAKQTTRLAVQSVSNDCSISMCSITGVPKEISVFNYTTGKLIANQPVNL